MLDKPSLGYSCLFFNTCLLLHTTSQPICSSGFSLRTKVNMTPDGLAISRKGEGRGWGIIVPVEGNATPSPL